MFDALRTFDGTDVTEIFAQCPDDAGLGLAVGNRLKKAAGFHLIDGDAPVVIGITGGTGSGKTSALQALEALGGTVLDCDAVYHQALREDETLRRRIRDSQLTLESLQVGTRSRTDVVLCYMLSLIHI